jgi:hypothetical protein
MRKFTPFDTVEAVDADPEMQYPFHFDSNIEIPDGKKYVLVTYTSPLDLDGLGPFKYTMRCVRFEDLPENMQGKKTQARISHYR